MTMIMSAKVSSPFLSYHDVVSCTNNFFVSCILIATKTKRQLDRCKQRMMNVLHDRRLSLSRKKTRIGRIDVGFHFLGIHYPGTQTQDNTNVTQANDRSVIQLNAAHNLTSLGGGDRCRN